MGYRESPDFLPKKAKKSKIHFLYSRPVSPVLCRFSVHRFQKRSRGRGVDLKSSHTPQMEVIGRHWGVYLTTRKLPTFVVHNKCCLRQHAFYTFFFCMRVGTKIVFFGARTNKHVFVWWGGGMFRSLPVTFDGLLRTTNRFKNLRATSAKRVYIYILSAIARGMYVVTPSPFSLFRVRSP